MPVTLPSLRVRISKIWQMALSSTSESWNIHHKSDSSPAGYRLQIKLTYFNSRHLKVLRFSLKGAEPRGVSFWENLPASEYRCPHPPRKRTATSSDRTKCRVPTVQNLENLKRIDSLHITFKDKMLVVLRTWVSLKCCYFGDHAGCF